MINETANPLLAAFDLKPGVSCRNRVAMAAMTHYSAPDDDGVTEAELQYIARRSKGPGLVFTACVSISEQGKAYDGEPGAYDDRLLPGLRRWAEAIKGEGAKAILQLHHGGGVCPPRLVPMGDVVSPSGIATPDRSEVQPRILCDVEIDAIVDDFARATARAIDAGFDGVEIHGGYGYLPQQFLSGYTNRRHDRWGGDWERRCAFPLALIAATRTVASDRADRPFVVGYRFTPEENLENGLTMDEALVFVDALIDAGTDYIDILLNDYRSPPRVGSMPKDKSRLALIAARIGGRVPVLAGGSIYTEKQALEALEAGADVVTLGRALIIEPEWVQKVAQPNSGALRTSLAPEDRDALTVPEPFWRTIWNAPGWFPGVG